MVAIKEQIMENLDFLNEQQLLELADYSTFLKIRSRMHNYNLKYSSLLSKYSEEDKELAEFGMAEYNNSLLEEDRL